MELEELYDYMSELIGKAVDMCGDESIMTPSEAIDALTDLMEEDSYNIEIGDLIDEIAYIQEDIDSKEAQNYFDDEELYESKKRNMKKIVRLTESDLNRIVKRVIKEQDEFLDDDDYYGFFDDDLKINRFSRNVSPNDDFDDFDEEEFEDFDSYRGSKYAKDPFNKWAFNDPREKEGRKYFGLYQDKSGGKPFKIRRRRR